MKRLLIASLAAASLAAAAAPALAQPYAGRGYYGGGGYSDAAIDQHKRDLARRINEGFERGQLTRNEAYSLNERLKGVQDQEWRYRHNGSGGPGGLSDWERRNLIWSLNDLDRRIEINRHDEERRGGWGDPDRYRH